MELNLGDVELFNKDIKQGHLHYMQSLLTIKR